MNTATPPNELAVPASLFIEEMPSETPITPPNSAPMSRSSSKGPAPFRAQLPVGKAFVNLTKPTEPPVTYLEMLKFIWWSIMVILTQLWRDLTSGKFYKPLLSTDFMTHYFVSCLRLLAPLP